MTREEYIDKQIKYLQSGKFWTPPFTSQSGVIHQIYENSTFTEPYDGPSIPIDCYFDEGYVASKNGQGDLPYGLKFFTQGQSYNET